MEQTDRPAKRAPASSNATEPNLSSDSRRRLFTALGVAATATIMVLSAPAFAQQSGGATTVAPGADPAAGTQASRPTKSGYTTGASLEGGDSVTEDLARDDVDVGSILKGWKYVVKKLGTRT